MRAELSPETKGQLLRYLDGNLSNAELSDWLAGAEYDSAIPQEERDALARISLVLVEVQEGRRRTSEILGIVAAVLVLARPNELVISPRTGSTTSWQGEPRTTTAMPTPLQPVGIRHETASV